MELALYKFIIIIIIINVPQLYKIYAILWDNKQFICCYCNFTALKLEANNVNQY